MTEKYAYETVKPEYTRLWASMTVTKPTEATKQANYIIAHKSRYQAVSDKVKGRVPWFVIGCLHMRESNGDFNTWLHNGDPMRNKQGRPIQTVHVPDNRPPDPNVSWEDGAVDALMIEELDRIQDWCPERVAYAAEKFNGWGYRNPQRDIPTPYDWGGTSVQKPGKFIRDGVYAKIDKDGHPLWDPQIGVMAVLRELMTIDSSIKFAEAQAIVQETVTAPPTQPEGAPKQAAPAEPVDGGDTDAPPPPMSPAAIDTTASVKPMVKSKTIWGGIITWLTGLATTFAGMFQYIATPYGFAAFVVIVVLLCVGFFLIIKGRIDVNKIVQHLSDDPPAAEPEAKS